MKKSLVRSLSILLALSCFSVCAASCGLGEGSDSESSINSTSSTSSTESSVDNTSTLDSELEIRVAVLSGATGYGAAKLMNDASAKTTALNYTINVESSPLVVQSSLIAKEVDIAALPTNKAAMIANADDGLIQVAAVNTLGVMYLVTSDGTTLSSFDDLYGKTIGIPEEPSYILNALCTANGLTVNEDVTIDTYATPADLLAAVIKGDVPYAVLPEPLLSTAMSKKSEIQISMNLTEEWEKIYKDSQLMQGCIVVRTEWANEHPAELAEFLKEYKASIEYVQANPEDSSIMIETYFGTAAAVAELAISRCNMTYLGGEEMKNGLQALYNILIDIPSAGIGDKVPDDSFYYNAT